MTDPESESLTNLSDNLSVDGMGTQLGEVLLNAKNELRAVTSFVESTKLSTSEILGKIGEYLSGAQQSHNEISQLVTGAQAAKSLIEETKTAITGKLESALHCHDQIDKTKTDVDQLFVSASQQCNEIEGQKSRAQNAADSAAEVLANILTTKGAVDSDAGAIATCRSNSVEWSASTKALADKALSVEARLAKYETELDELKTKSTTQLGVILALLPGATSAGLAHAFNQRGATFKNPAKRWQWIFVGSLFFLAILAATGLWHVYSLGTTMTYDELFRLWLARIPVAAILAWLAVHAGRESALAKRLEEDYGYKSAIAASFQGFHAQMSDISDKAGSDTPLAKLCADTLATIGSPPGRIYEKHQLTTNPSDELKDIVKTAAEAVKSQIKAKP